MVLMVRLQYPMVVLIGDDDYSSIMCHLASCGYDVVVVVVTRFDEAKNRSPYLGEHI